MTDDARVIHQMRLAAYAYDQAMKWFNDHKHEPNFDIIASDIESEETAANYRRAIRAVVQENSI